MFSPFRYFVVLLLAVVMSAGFLRSASAQSLPHIVIDLENGEVLSANAATNPWHPASITKLMTLYVAAKAIRNGELSMQSTLTMSENARRQPPSKMGFKVGTQVTMDNAFKMLMVKSANDIAVAIGERVSGSESAFIAEMNRTAKELGMSGSHFVNPHGLPASRQIVTARDMALLGRAIHREFPELAPLFKIPAIKLGNLVLRSHNLLLEHYRGTTGMKTGFTCASGLTLVASAKRGKSHYLAVVLGEQSSIDRAEKAALLLEYAFEGRFKGTKTRLDRYRPQPTRSEPANMRNRVCNQASKIRQFQIVAPQPKPQKKLFGRNQYESPQRKFFGERLGDKSHPQGALVVSPGNRKYRSHILQPRIQLPTVDVYAGPFQGSRSTDLAIKLNKNARRNLAKAPPLAPPTTGVPLPRLHPDQQAKRNALSTNGDGSQNRSGTEAINPTQIVTASAFLSEPRSVPTNSASLHQQSLVAGQSRVQIRDTQGSQIPGQPLSLTAARQSAGVVLPRPNPLR